MAHHPPADPALPSRLITPPVRLPGSRAVVGALLVTLAAIGTFVAATGDDDERRVPVVIASHQVVEGTRITADDVALLHVSPPSAGSSFARIDDVVGRTAIAPIAPGDLLQSSALTEDHPDGGREVLLHLPAEQVAIAHLRPGERVDVLSTTDDETIAVLLDAEVLELGVTDDESLLAERDVDVVVLVDKTEEVAALVHAARTTELTLIRSTGAVSPVDSPAPTPREEDR